MMQRILLTLILFTSICTYSIAQSFHISGIITAEDHRALIGVSVVEKGTLNAAVTDFEGRFSLFVHDSLSTLVFSYTGYTTKEHRLDGNNDPLKIRLAAAERLEEVVVGRFSKEAKKRDKSFLSRSDVRTADFAPASSPMPIAGFATPAAEATTVMMDREITSKGMTSAMMIAQADAAAGTLTAGEIHDFSKWDLWQDVAAEDLMMWREYWKIYPAQRYPLQLTNKEGQAVVNATVKLLDERNALVYEAKTDNTGKAECWDHLFSAEKGANRTLQMLIEYDGGKYPLDRISSFQQGYNIMSIPVACEVKDAIDIAFVVDATGSMQDEINYLKAELQDVIQRVQDTLPKADLRLGSVFYRDQGEAYLTRKSPLSSAINRTTDFIKVQDAQGGGDNPEAVEEALRVALEELSWRSEASTRLLFLVLDAPPHQSPEILATLERLTRLASAKGVRIIPIACSGIDKSTEYLMRSLALATNGTYTFLTNDSGVGFSHIEPTTDSYDVEKLNALLARVIYQFAYTRDCNAVRPIALNNPLDTGIVIATSDLPQNKDTKQSLASLRFYPNPSSGPVNVEANGIDELYLADFSGKILERFSIKEEQSTIDIGQYPAGTYHLRFRTDNDEWLGDQLVLTR